MMKRGTLLAAALGVLVVGFPCRARADIDFELAANLNGAWLRQLPALRAGAVTTSAREMGKGTVAGRGGVGLLGPVFELALTFDDKWKMPLFGGAAAWAVGPYDTIVTSFDGSIAELRPWSTFRADLLLPGVGRRFKHRRNMWGIGIRSGVSYVSMGGSVAAGRERWGLDLEAVTFLVQAEIEGCRRLDPTTRICLQIAPRLYEHSFMNGLTAGLRYEWGR
jgi:hypothetical protein